MKLKIYMKKTIIVRHNVKKNIVLILMIMTYKSYINSVKSTF